MPGIRLAIVDDHQLFAEALKNILPIYTHIQSIETFPSGHSFFTFLESNTIDLVLLDLGIKDGQNGFQILEELKYRRPQIKVIVVSMHTQAEYMARVQQLGGNGYVPKDAGASVLKEAIQSVMTTDTFFSIDSSELANPFNSLSATENKIALALLQGLSNKQIAENFHRSKETIDTHRKNIYRKLEVSSVIDFVKLGVKYGMVIDAIE